MALEIGEFYYDMDTTTAPANPAGATTYRYYTKSDGNLYKRDSAGTETQVGGGGSSPFSESGGVISATTTGNTLTLGSSSAGGKLFIDGDADEVQLQVQANGTQTNALAKFEDSGGTSLVTITGTGSVGIGATPGSSALLQVDSTTKGFLPPRVTTTQRDAISTPATGLTVYNTSNSRTETYNGSAWVGGASGNFTELTAYTELGASASSIDITSISGSYDILLLVLNLRTDRASTLDDQRIRFNADSGSNYYAYTSRISGTTPTSSGAETLAGTGIVVTNSIPANTSPANYFGMLNVYIYGYALTSRPRRVSYQGMALINTTTGNLFSVHGGGYWTNTANAITQITVTPGTGTNFVTGSSYALYGIG